MIDDLQKVLHNNRKEYLQFEATMIIMGYDVAYEHKYIYFTNGELTIVSNKQIMNSPHVRYLSIHNYHRASIETVNYSIQHNCDELIKELNKHAGR